MRLFIRLGLVGVVGLVLSLGSPSSARAQPAGSGASPAGSARVDDPFSRPRPSVPVEATQPPTAGNAAGSAAPIAGPVGIMPTVPDEPPAMTGRTAKDLRETCAAAMNADPTFATAIVKVADKAAAERRLALDLMQHEIAATAVAKNERHVILAYASMWLVAVGFLVFLWRRQQSFKSEVAQLRRDLDAALKDPGK